jgi:hypothetical protein
MEEIILRKDVTMNDLKLKLEHIISEIKRAEKEKYFTAGSINEMIASASLQSKKNLEELASTELLGRLFSKIKNETKTFSEIFKFKVSAQDLANLLDFVPEIQKSNPNGYFKDSIDDIRALEGVKYHEGEIFEKAYEKIRNAGKFLDDNVLFSELMRIAFVLILRRNVEILKSENKIEDENNLKFEDLKLICNEIARSLKENLPFEE